MGTYIDSEGYTQYTPDVSPIGNQPTYMGYTFDELKSMDPEDFITRASLAENYKNAKYLRNGALGNFGGMANIFSAGLSSAVQGNWNPMLNLASSMGTMGLSDFVNAHKEGGSFADRVDRAADPGGFIDAGIREGGSQLGDARPWVNGLIRAVGAYYGPLTTFMSSMLTAKLNNQSNESGMNQGLIAAGASILGGIAASYGSSALNTATNAMIEAGISPAVASTMSNMAVQSATQAAIGGATRGGQGAIEGAIGGAIAGGVGSIAPEMSNALQSAGANQQVSNVLTNAVTGAGVNAANQAIKTGSVDPIKMGSAGIQGGISSYGKSEGWDPAATAGVNSLVNVGSKYLNTPQAPNSFVAPQPNPSFQATNPNQSVDPRQATINKLMGLTNQNTRMSPTPVQPNSPQTGSRQTTMAKLQGLLR